MVLMKTLFSECSQKGEKGEKINSETGNYRENRSISYYVRNS